MSDSTGTGSSTAGLLAIDVGSSRVKLGWYPPSAACTAAQKPGALPIAEPRLPLPVETLVVPHHGALHGEERTELQRWLDQLGAGQPRCFLASVHPQATAAVLEVLQDYAVAQPYRLGVEELAIEVRVEQPERVGVDRLLNALAANRLREPQRPAIVADLGTASTVDFIAADGAFEGGAILPGIAISAAGLHSGTAALPQLALEALLDVPPKVIGKSTSSAIASGLYWGTVGAVRELVQRMSQPCDVPPQVFVTGGDAPRLAAELFGDEGTARHIPHLVLAGIYLAAQELL